MIIICRFVWNLVNEQGLVKVVTLFFQLLFTNDRKIQKVTKMYSTVNAMNQLKKSLFMGYNLLYKRNLSLAAANRPGETNNFLARAP